MKLARTENKRSLPPSVLHTHRYPSGYHPYGSFLSADDSSVPGRRLTPQDAATQSAAAAAGGWYGHEWAPCKGRCVDGVCALKWDHQTCCSLNRNYNKEEAEARHHQGQLSSKSAADTTATTAHHHRSGRRLDHDLFCRDY